VRYHVYSQSGIGAVGVIVETRKALAKAAEVVENGNPDVIIKDLLGTYLITR
jgi:hypothetical protein